TRRIDHLVRYSHRAGRRPEHNLAFQLWRHTPAQMLDPRSVLPIIDETMGHAAESLARRVPTPEEGQKHGRHNEQQREGDAAPIGQMAQGLFFQECAQDAPTQMRYGNGQPATSLLERRSCELEERFVEIELARLQAGHAAERDALAEFSTLIATVQVKGSPAAIRQNAVYLALDMALPQS